MNLQPAAWMMLAGLYTSNCEAQVWLPSKGEGSFSLTFQNVVFNGHYQDDGSKEPPGLDGSRAINLIAEWSYSPTNRVNVTFAVPYTWNRYTGSEPPVQPSALDDRLYHGTFQDFRVETAINLAMHPIVITPVVAVVAPSHNYRVVGEAAPGRGLNEYWVGVGVGRMLNPFLPRSYAQVRYVYAIVARVLDIPNNRSNLDFSLGYYVSPRISLAAVGSYQKTHGGITVDEVFSDEESPGRFFNHDRLLRANFLHAGVAASVSLSQSIDIQASVQRFLSGSSTHYGWATTVGATWTFQTKGKQKTGAPPAVSTVPVNK